MPRASRWDDLSSTRRDFRGYADGMHRLMRQKELAFLQTDIVAVRRDLSERLLGRLSRLWRLCLPRSNGFRACTESATRRALAKNKTHIHTYARQLGEGALRVPSESPGVVAIPVAPRVGRTSH